MLVFPEQVLKGALPNRDFLHLYGPGSLWALAGVFKVFGVSIVSERAFGLLQQLAIVFGIFALARRWGRTLAVTAAVTSALIIIPFGFTALAWVGGVGLAVCGLAAGIEARASADERASAPVGRRRRSAARARGAVPARPRARRRHRDRSRSCAACRRRARTVSTRASPPESRRT